MFIQIADITSILEVFIVVISMEINIMLRASLTLIIIGIFLLEQDKNKNKTFRQKTLSFFTFLAFFSQTIIISDIIIKPFLDSIFFK